MWKREGVRILSECTVYNVCMPSCLALVNTCHITFNICGAKLFFTINMHPYNKAFHASLRLQTFVKQPTITNVMIRLDSHNLSWKNITQSLIAKKTVKWSAGWGYRPIRYISCWHFINTFHAILLHFKWMWTLVEYFLILWKW